MMITTPRKTAALASLVLALSLSMGTPARAQSEADRDALKQEIVKEVVEEIRNSDVLQEAVQEGIRDFIQRQQQAQAEARQQQQEIADRKAQDVRPVSTESDHIYGNPDAEVSLIEYSDFECPYCKRFHTTAKDLVDQSDGRINWVYRHFPLGFHNPGAQKQAEASECAAELGGNDAFWAYTDTIYERTSSGGEGFPLDQLTPLAAELGLDKEKFSNCLESGRYEEKVQNDMAEAVRIGINGTPGNVLLNNETGKALVRAGAQPLEAMEEAARMLLAGEG